MKVQYPCIINPFTKVNIWDKYNYQTDRAALSSTSSIRAKDALKQHDLPALRHSGKVLLILHSHQRSLPKSSKSETRFYQTELASTAVKTLKEVMEDTEVQCKDCSSQDVPGVGWRHW